LKRGKRSIKNTQESIEKIQMLPKLISMKKILFETEKIIKYGKLTDHKY
jgi:hypothetical protein